jgi:phospholipid/cholesterol/gamma-HCH transport system substrate-binding protein
MPSARRVAWAKFRAVAVCATGIVILLVLFYLLAGGTLFQQKGTLYMYIADATGLAPGSPVRVDGIAVGRVASVALSNSTQPQNTVKVTLSVVRSEIAKIPADSYAQISAETLIGDMFVDVTSGHSTIPIRSGAVIPFKEQGLQIKSIDLTQFEAQLRSIDAMLRDIELGRNRVGQFIVGEDIYRSLAKRLDELDRGLRAAVAATTPFGQALYTDRLYQRISAPLLDFDRTLARLASGQGTAGAFLRDSAEYERLRSSAAGLRSSIDAFRANDLVASDTRYENWNGALASVIRSIDRFNTSPLLETSAMYDNLAGSMRSVQEGMRDFHANPKKFMRTKVF